MDQQITVIRLKRKKEDGGHDVLLVEERPNKRVRSGGLLDALSKVSVGEEGKEAKLPPILKAEVEPLYPKAVTELFCPSLPPPPSEEEREPQSFVFQRVDSASKKDVESEEG